MSDADRSVADVEADLSVLSCEWPCNLSAIRLLVSKVPDAVFAVVQRRTALGRSQQPGHTASAASSPAGEFGNRKRMAESHLCASLRVCVCVCVCVCLCLLSQV